MAGGKGLRFGGDIRKQYLLLNRHPVLWWSLAAFNRCSDIGNIVLVVPQDDVRRVKHLTSSWQFKKLTTVVAGGETRAESVRNGLSVLLKGIRWVAIHDAVRPFASQKLIRQTLREAKRHGAAIAACPSKDTVKLANGDRCIKSTPPRETVWLAQTPQIFDRTLLEKAHAEAPEIVATDDAQLVERLGIKVRLVEAPPENLKITRPIDLVLAKAILCSE